MKSATKFSVGALLAAIVSLGAFGAQAQTAEEQPLFDKILAQGVPSHGLKKIFEFLHQRGQTFNVDTYTCTNLDADNMKPCEENKRVSKTKAITLEPLENAVVVDFTKSSLERRFFLINLKTGAVKKLLTTHGKGSGNGPIAYKFSNTKDSLQTALGMYVTGGTYKGHYGETLRLYGLEKSDDNAYERDIVMHGAPYAHEDFIKQINPNTKKPYGRLGVSWGCPAVSFDNIKMLIPLLKGGALVYLDHAELAEKALSGKEVVGQAP